MHEEPYIFQPAPKHNGTINLFLIEIIVVVMALNAVHRWFA